MVQKFLVRMTKFVGDDSVTGKSAKTEIPCGGEFFTPEEETADRVSVSVVMSGVAERAYVYGLLDRETGSWELSHVWQRETAGQKENKKFFAVRMSKNHEGEWISEGKQLNDVLKPVTSPVWAER